MGIPSENLFASNAFSYNELFGYGKHLPDADLYGHWEMQETSGTTVSERSGNGVDGTAKVSLSTSTGPTGYLPVGQVFGGSQIIGFGANASMSPTLDGSHTELGWLKWAGGTSTGVIASRWRNSGSFAGRGLYFQNNKIRLIKGNDSRGGSENRAFTESSNTVSASNWTHWAAKIDGRNASGHSLYIDGQPLSLVTLDDNATGEIVYGTSEALIAARGSLASSNLSFEGEQAGYAYFTRALSSDEITQAYAGPEPYFSSAPSAPTGTTQVGQTLTANPDTIADPNNGSITYTYQWVRADDNAGAGQADISGETGATYTLAAEDAGKYVAVKMTPSNDGGTDSLEVDTRSAYTDPITGPSVTFKPAWAMGSNRTIQSFAR